MNVCLEGMFLIALAADYIKPNIKYKFSCFFTSGKKKALLLSIYRGEKMRIYTSEITSGLRRYRIRAKVC